MAATALVEVRVNGGTAAFGLHETYVELVSLSPEAGRSRCLKFGTSTLKAGESLLGAPILDGQPLGENPDETTVDKMLGIRATVWEDPEDIGIGRVIRILPESRIPDGLICHRDRGIIPGPTTACTTV